ncbi:indolepyruvate oxidoreductase subunit beta family protein [Nitratireductor sp. XY-223]|uniref:indolepyruvate oxidoreductase subunit beta family protein n=1 Tax=Nitratireductor sp. XY-223 TaxID=2561926 RepID=UPI0010AAE342|nr:indolepyruvate oxidoreductase subunit beta family protein [Nitratireductor sp. XY-223]
MNELARKTADPRLGSIIKLAIMAVGGQGGSVLTNWIEDCARASGYAVQATSVAGVAQRTGATIYYIEMAPAAKKQPVFSLMPAAGDVDILIAAEMMEAGRAILRGFVTPDRTTLVASSHRALAVSEKTVPGDGMANADEVVAAAKIAAQRLVLFDMNKIAVDNGTVISASLLGALAGSETLPFSREAFETAIRASGRGVENSLAAFNAAYEAVGAEPTDEKQDEPGADRAAQPSGSESLLARYRALESRAESLPGPVAEMAVRGLRSVIDFQDFDYGREYLDRLERVLALDNAKGEHALSREAAKYIARAMAYDDVIRVADLKTRLSRFERIRQEMNPQDGTRMKLTEFMHPRAEEIVGMLPARLGRSLSGRPGTMKVIDRLFNRGRRLRSDRVLPFLQLYVVGGLRRWRRGTYRHAIERDHLETWLDTALGYVAADYDLAVEVIRNRRLIKGYSDTHARGLSKFDKVMDGASIVAGRPDAADWVRRLREAALQDEQGKALDGALQTIRSFTEPQSAA